MISIDRNTFRTAIEQGIAHDPDLTPLDRENLRNFGATATSFGLNFCNGCPAAACGVGGTLAKPRLSDDGWTVGVKFAWGFDDYLKSVAPEIPTGSMTARVKVLD